MMRRRSPWMYALIVVFAGSVLFGASAARAESIVRFDASIAVESDASITVQETIIYDFAESVRHGIYRDIPVSYRARGGTYTLRVSEESVENGFGQRVPFETSRQGSMLRLKIGDPVAVVTGERTYVISYRVERALNAFAEHDELYWNITGNGWQVPMGEVTADVRIPGNPDAASLRTACFQGSEGSTTPCAEAQSETGLALFSTGALEPGEGLTVVVGFPKGLVRMPSRSSELLAAVRDNSILFLPFAAFGFLLWFWWTRGRDPQGRGAWYPEYAPPDGITPAEAGTLLDERAHTRDISAALIGLAVKGYLKIERTEEKALLFGTNTDYTFIQQKSPDASLAGHEQVFLKKLFASAVEVPGSAAQVTLSKLKGTFAKDLAAVKSQLYDDVVLKGYFPRSPGTVRTIWASCGFGLIGLGWFLGGLMGPLAVGSVAATGILIALFGLIMPKKTRTGARMRERLLGLKEYVSLAEGERLKFSQAPEKNPAHFEKLLPYAMAFGVEEAWAKQFAALEMQPSWYADAGNRGMFNALTLSHALSGFSAEASSALAYTPRSSASGGGSGFSGGFSGGGFGGGGGGSW